MDKEWNRTQNVLLAFVQIFLESLLFLKRTEKIFDENTNQFTFNTQYDVLNELELTLHISEKPSNINLQGNSSRDIHFVRCRNSYMKQIPALHNYMNSSEKLVGFPSVNSKTLLESNDMYF